MDRKSLAENLRKFGDGLSPSQETFMTAGDFGMAADFVEASDIFTTEDMVVLRAIRRQRELLNEIADARKELIETEKLLSPTSTK